MSGPATKGRTASRVASAAAASALLGALALGAPAYAEDPVADQVVWQEYLEVVARERSDWADLYDACREVSG